jgi:glycosyltransferase involved in cell wall biosynthesis
MKILIIAYYYPPLVGGGSLRPLRMAKHLPDYNHQVKVLTHTYQKTTIKNDLILIFDPSYNCKRQGYLKIKWLIKRIFTEICNIFGFYHSIYAWWRKNVMKNIPMMEKSFTPDLILATYPPIECLEIGIQLAAHWQVPLITDFRDGLLFEPIESKRLSAFSCIRRHYQHTEATVVQESHAIIAAHPMLKEYFLKNYKKEAVFCLPNSFDPVDLEDIPPVDLSKKKIHLVHTGNFALSDINCDIVPFLTALTDFLSGNPDCRHKLQIHQLGLFNGREKKAAGQLMEWGTLRYHGQKDRKTCLSFQREADLLLLITSESRPSVSPGKLFEYLQAETPILALTKGSFVSEIINDSRSGWIFNSQDLTGIVKFIEAFLTDKKLKKSFHPNSEVTEKFNLKNQIKNLNQIIQKVQREYESPS